ncbi:hypothetical protein N0V82_003820 [Gnomoniopsis sp. IMI 355080]|nr:hypothetical protein N0V82_003820 [Gnomoniopsis sp. IMI 355080]
MYSSTILLATLAATVSATIPLHQRFVEARQTDIPSASLDSSTASATDNAACESAADDIDSILAGAPTVPDNLASYAATATDILTADLCSYPFPTSVASDWSSYSSAYASWVSASAGSEIASVASACGTTIDSSDLDLCTSDAGVASGATADSTATTTESDATTTASEASGLTTETTGSATKTSASGSSGTAKATVTATAGAVAREVGTVGAIFVGVLGAVVAL